MLEIELTIKYINQLQRDIDATQHRGVLVLSGEKAWAEQLLAQWCIGGDDSLWGGDNSLWVGDPAAGGIRPPECMPGISGKQAHQVLGQERSLLVFDSWSGFNPNAFGQVSGVLVAGALLVLVVPALEEWPDFSDPEYQSIAALPYQVADVGNRFIKHLCRVITQDDRLVLIEQGKPLPAVARSPMISSTGSYQQPYRSQDQQQVVETLLEQLQKRSPAPMVLTADRGRGKSAALGLVAALMLRKGTRRVLVTAPSSGAIQALLEIAQQQLPGSERSTNAVTDNSGSIEFYQPDRLLNEQPEADLLLVDEAAAIPAPVLQQLLLSQRRIVFASTIHGYEGTGQGFAVRFRQVLDKYAPSWRALSMSQPVRWAAGDPLEAFTFKALLLDAEPAEIQPADQPTIQYRQLDREQLFQDQRLLQELFGLLVLAHYRTTPGDLRILLDSPNLQIWAAYSVTADGEHLIATALLAEEGPVEQPLADEIWAGRRRPKGHLIPQILLAQEGIKAAALNRGLRVMRIAVHPCLQRSGIGLGLLQQIEKYCLQAGFDWLGSSFGLTAELHSFWRRAGFNSLRLGLTRDAVSGTHAVIMLKGLTTKGVDLQNQVACRLQEQFPWLLVEQFRDLEHTLVIPLLAELRLNVELTAQDKLDAVAFATTERQFDSCKQPLRKLLLKVAGENSLQALPDAQQQLLLGVVLQSQSWNGIAVRLEVNSQKALLREARSAVRKLLGAC